MAEGRQQRRSARISALDTWRLSALTRASGAPRGRRGRRPASSAHPAPTRGRKRGRKKRRLRAVVEVVVSSAGAKGVDSGGGSDDEEKADERHHRHHHQPAEEEEVKDGRVLNQDDDLGGTERSVGSPSMPWIPDKKTLELILDILQRKDTHEIFAEPVDPEEVEGYYDIIKEPMDFGTMRAKLQEGMYATLEQFERDVFLISGNAMHFNSSTTIYYRQARAIQELAKKTFHSLKTDPENFVLDHLSKKTKTGKIVNKISRVSGNSRAQGESRSSDRGSASALANTKQRNATPDGTPVISNERHGSLLASLSSGKNQHPPFTPHGPSPFSDHRRDQEEDVGSVKDGWRSCFAEEDRRSTYRSWSPSSSRSDSTFLPFFGGPRYLVYVNEGDFRYVESLTRFAADLGPTAQMVAQRKIKRCKMLEAATAASLSASQLQLPLDNMTSACSASSGYSDATERAHRDQTLTVQPGSIFPSFRSGLPVSHAAVGSVVPEPTVQSNSNQMLVSTSDLGSPSVSQSKLLEIVSRNGNTWVAGNGGADSDLRRLVYCHDNGASLTGLTKNTAKTTSSGTELGQGISFTRNGLWPHHPESSLLPSFSQLPRQPAVLDLSFVQARLNGLSSGCEGQGQGSKPTDPLVEPHIPSYSTDAWEQARKLRSEAKPPSRSIPDSQQPDLALQL